MQNVNNAHILKEMEDYYSETARWYKLNGATINEPDIPDIDNKYISSHLWEFGAGHLIDIACGSGIWLPKYYRNVREFTFLDRSRCILDLCKDRVEDMHLQNVSRFINCDIHEYEFMQDTYDSAFVGFLLSHLRADEEIKIFAKIKNSVKRNGKVVFIDSVLTPEILEKRRLKRGIIVRSANDKEYSIYKNYFEKNELERLLRANGFKIAQSYFGSKVTLVIGVNLK